MRLLHLLLAAAAAALCLFAASWRLPRLYRACAEHAQKLHRAQWLRARCDADPEFRAHMAHLCSTSSDPNNNKDNEPTVRAFALALLREELPAPPSPPLLLAFVLLAVLVPNVLLPLGRFYWDRAEHRRLLRACSPDIRLARNGAPLIVMRRRAAIRAFASSSSASGAEPII